MATSYTEIFADGSGVTATTSSYVECKHQGECVSLSLWVLKRKYLICWKCHELIPQSNYGIRDDMMGMFIVVVLLLGFITGLKGLLYLLWELIKIGMY